MKLRKAIKKIVALGAGATMVGATIMGAMAADMSNYPAPFVKDGMFDAMIVVGDNAKASDVIGAVDVATSLQYSMKQTTTVAAVGGVTQVALTGDSIEIGMPGDMLEIMEYLEENKETIIDEDLEALEDGFISTSKGSTDYEQKLVIPASSGRVIFDKDPETDVIGPFLFYNKNAELMTYEMTFSEGLESDIDDTVLDDIEDKSLTFMGMTYSIINADLSSTDELTIELMSGDVRDTLDEGESKTYTIAGVDYEVEVLVINDVDSEVKFRINDEVTDVLTDGETYRTTTGIEIGVREVVPNEAGDITADMVEFYLGADKIELKDTDADEGTMEMSDELIDDAIVTMAWTNTSDEITIDSIEIQMLVEGVEGDVYVVPGTGVREYLEEPETMLHDGWNMVFEGLTDTGMSEIEFKASGDESYKLDFVNIDGAEYSMPLVDSSTDVFLLGTDDETLYFVEETYANETAGEFVGDKLIAEDDYFILSSKTDINNDKAVTHVMQFDKIRSTVDTKELTFSDISDGSSKTVKYTLDADSDDAENQTLGTATLSVGGKEYDVKVVNAIDANDDYKIAIDMNADDAINGSQMEIVTKGGAIIFFDDDDVSDDALEITVRTLGENFDETTTDEDILVNLTQDTTDTDEVRLDIVSGVTLHQVEDNDDLKLGATLYGAELAEDRTDDAADFVIEYPLAQRGAQVFVTAGKVASSTVGAGGAVESVTLEAIEVGSAVLASEVANVAAQNLMMVGGPCANEAARKVMGVTMDNCAEGFAPGKAILKLYDTGAGKVALLVAGDQPMDTRAAARVLANYDSYDLSGDEIAITYTSLSDITVSEVV